VTSLKVIWH